MVKSNKENSFNRTISIGGLSVHNNISKILNLANILIKDDKFIPEILYKLDTVFRDWGVELSDEEKELLEYLKISHLADIKQYFSISKYLASISNHQNYPEIEFNILSYVLKVCLSQQYGIQKDYVTTIKRFDLLNKLLPGFNEKGALEETALHFGSISYHFDTQDSLLTSSKGKILFKNEKDAFPKMVGHNKAFFKKICEEWTNSIIKNILKFETEINNEQEPSGWDTLKQKGYIQEYNLLNYYKNIADSNAFDVVKDKIREDWYRVFPKVQCDEEQNLKGEENTDCQLKESDLEEIFQNFITPLLTQKPASFLLDIDSTVPIIIKWHKKLGYDLECKTIEVADGKILHNFLEISGDIKKFEEIIEDFIANCMKQYFVDVGRQDGSWVCNRYNPGIQNVVQPCPLYKKMKKENNKSLEFLLGIKEKLRTFNVEYGSNPDSPKDKIDNWNLCDLIQFVLPIVLLDQPFVIASIQSWKRYANNKRHAISFSVTIEPRAWVIKSLKNMGRPKPAIAKGSELKAEQNYLRAWGANYASRIDLLAKGITDIFAELDLLNARSQKAREEEWRKISHTIAHEFGHLIAPLEGRFDFAVRAYEHLSRRVGRDCDVEKLFSVSQVKNGIQFAKFIVAAFGSNKISNRLVKEKHPSIVSALKELWQVSAGAALFVIRESRKRPRYTDADIFSNACWQGLSIFKVQEDLVDLHLPYDEDDSKISLQRLRGEAILAILFHNILEHFFRYYEKVGNRQLSNINIEELLTKWKLGVYVYKRAEDPSKIEIEVTNVGEGPEGPKDKDMRGKDIGTELALRVCLEDKKVWDNGMAGEVVWMGWEDKHIFRTQLILPQEMFIGL